MFKLVHTALAALAMSTIFKSRSVGPSIMSNPLSLAPSIFLPGTYDTWRSRNPRRRRSTGYAYPHSSARQQARYRRQIAAGQLSMDGVQ